MLNKFLVNTIKLTSMIGFLCLNFSSSQSLETASLLPQLTPLPYNHGVCCRLMLAINELESHVQEIRIKNQEDKIVLALDWDNTISKENGSNTPLREGDMTQTILSHIINKYNVHPCILTSRFDGKSPDMMKGKISLKEIVKIVGEKMLEAAPFLKNTPILNQSISMGNFKIAEIPHDLSKHDHNDEVIFYKGIIFSGSSKPLSQKGRALVQLMEGEWIQTDEISYSFIQLDYDHVIFVDNDHAHISAVARAFQNHPKKNNITLIYYPEPVEIDEIEEALLINFSNFRLNPNNSIPASNFSQ